MATTVLKLKPRKSGSAIPLASATRRRCPLVRYRACWCRGLCSPHRGIGQCGQPAPHAKLGRTQQAIASYKAKRASRGV